MKKKKNIHSTLQEYRFEAEINSNKEQKHINRSDISDQLKAERALLRETTKQKKSETSRAGSSRSV